MPAASWGGGNKKKTAEGHSTHAQRHSGIATSQWPHTGLQNEQAATLSFNSSQYGCNPIVVSVLTFTAGSVLHSLKARRALTLKGPQGVYTHSVGAQGAVLTLIHICGRSTSGRLFLGRDFAQFSLNLAPV